MSLGFPSRKRFCVNGYEKPAHYFFLSVRTPRHVLPCVGTIFLKGGFMIQNLRMSAKIALGFLLVTIILAIVVIVTLLQVAHSSSVTEELLERDQPAAESSLRVLNGVNESLALLRGWILLGDEKFRPQREAVWVNDIDPAIKRLKRLLTDGELLPISDIMALEKQNVENLTAIEKIVLIEHKLVELKQHQADIENIAQSEENDPAFKSFNKNAVPAADEVISAVTALIDSEAQLEGTAERKQLLVHLADFRASFALGINSLQAFLSSGDVKFQTQFDDRFKLNTSVYQNVKAKAELFQRDQVDAWKRLQTNRDIFAPLSEQIVELRKANQWDLATVQLSEEAVPRAQQIRVNLESLLKEDLRPQVTAKRDDVISNAARLKTMLWSLLLAGVVISGLAGLLIIHDFNNLGDSVRSLLSELGTSTQEINASSQQQVASMTEATTSINEISSTSEEFKATIQEFADRARAVREAADEMARRAADGIQLTDSAATKNSEVRQSFEAAGESILKLSRQMQQITQITTSVNEIADQTKLLALNASIEAARAGEEGRGFAVVATQVRELANQSKEASSRIASQINDIQSSMGTVIRNSEEGNEKLTDANQMGKQMAHAFQEIVVAIDQTTDSMRQMDQAARQQEAGMTDLVTGISEINAGSRETLTTAEQTQKSIALVEQRAKELTKIVAQLKK